MSARDVSDETAVKAERIVVHPDRLEVHVQVMRTCERTTNAELIVRLLGKHPHLLDHACYNEQGNTFRACAYATSLPHLLEHLVVDYQVQWSNEETASFTGTTQWKSEEDGRALIFLSFTDDVCALSALKVALKELNSELSALRLCERS